MSLPYSHSLHESRNIVGEKLRRINAFRFIAFASPSEVERNTSKVLGVFRHLNVSAGLKGSHYRRFEVSQRAVSSLLKDTNALAGVTEAAGLSELFFTLPRLISSLLRSRAAPL